jgi:hypothetical protein
MMLKAPMSHPIMSRAILRKLTRPLWFLFAALFLFEAWLWDVLGDALKRLVALMPFEALKRALARIVDRLPAPIVLLIFLFPLAIIEPMKALGVWLMAEDHAVLGFSVFMGGQFAGVGVTAFMFDMTREKLLSMAWFERFYHWVLRVRAWAHQLLEPYQRRIREALAPFKQRLREILASLESRGGIGRKLALLRVRARRSRGLI